MYVVIGATGHTGSAIAKRLLAQEKKVRVVGRNTERLSSLVSLGAEPFAADVSNQEAITKAFSGAEAAYVMLPPDLANPDYAAYQDKVTEAIASALEKGGPAHIVALSSFGADKPDKTGPIAGTHRMEERLEADFGTECAVCARRIFHGEYAAADGSDSADGSDRRSAERGSQGSDDCDA